MEQNLVLVITGFTTVAAYWAGSRIFGLSGLGLGAASLAVLELIGTSVAFFVLNLFLGVITIVGIRTLMLGFLSAYSLNDIALLVLSGVQGLLFSIWREYSDSHRCPTATGDLKPASSAS